MVPLKALTGGLAIAALTTLASVVAPSGASATSFNYLVNGSFEDYVHKNRFYNHFTGWTEGGNFAPFTFVEQGGFGSYSGAEQGAFYVTAGPVGPYNTLSNGFLSQTFSDIKGQSLIVSGWYAAVGDSPSDLNVYFGASGTTLTDHLSLSDPNTGGAWTEFTFDVTGSGLDTFELAFADNPGWIALDNFSVIDPPTTTPLPAALPLFASGFAMMSLLGWRRKWKNTAAAVSCENKAVS
jgi:hypothetical protein